MFVSRYFKIEEEASDFALDGGEFQLKAQNSKVVICATPDCPFRKRRLWKGKGDEYRNSKWGGNFVVKIVGDHNHDPDPR